MNICEDFLGSFLGILQMARGREEWKAEMDLMNLSAEKVDVRPAHFYRTGLSESGGWEGGGGNGPSDFGWSVIPYLHQGADNDHQITTKGQAISKAILPKNKQNALRIWPLAPDYQTFQRLCRIPTKLEIGPVN